MFFYRELNEALSGSNNLIMTSSLNSILFGSIAINNSSSIVLTITAAGNQVETVTVSDNTDQFDFSPSFFVLTGSGGSETITIDFIPTITGSLTGNLILSASGGHVKSIPMSGISTSEENCSDYIPGSEVTNIFTPENGAGSAFFINSQADVEMLRGFNKADCTLYISDTSTITDPSPLNGLIEVGGLDISSQFFDNTIIPFSSLKFINMGELSITLNSIVTNIDSLLPELRRVYSSMNVYLDVNSINFSNFARKLKYAQYFRIIADSVTTPVVLNDCLPCFTGIPPADLMSLIADEDPSAPVNYIWQAYSSITLQGNINASGSLSSLIHAKTIVLNSLNNDLQSAYDNIASNLLEVGRIEGYFGEGTTTRNVFPSLQKVGEYGGYIPQEGTQLRWTKRYGSDITDTYGDFNSLQTVKKLLRLNITNIPADSSGKLPLFNNLTSVGSTQTIGEGGIWLENIGYNEESYNPGTAIWDNAFPALTSSAYINIPWTTASFGSALYTPSVISNFMNNVTILGGLQTYYPQVETANSLSASFQSLTVIKYNINISNTNLQNLNFLAGVTHMAPRLPLEDPPDVGGEISISENPQLTDVGGIMNISGQTISALGINNNQSLDQTDAEAVCEHYNSQRAEKDQLNCLVGIINNLGWTP